MNEIKAYFCGRLDFPPCPAVAIVRVNRGPLSHMPRRATAFRNWEIGWEKADSSAEGCSTCPGTWWGRLRASALPRLLLVACPRWVRRRGHVISA